MLQKRMPLQSLTRLRNSNHLLVIWREAKQSVVRKPLDEIPTKGRQAHVAPLLVMTSIFVIANNVKQSV
ncbi:hypothetical protein [Gaetbulibacter aestuarii]|uniref:Uncharacterized protein n=1 Tax=Gaetbulibacter aestuarii TaxID=1502358 RepID=A0ABW7MV74_9FLAO